MAHQVAVQCRCIESNVSMCVHLTDASRLGAKFPEGKARQPSESKADAQEARSANDDETASSKQDAPKVESEPESELGMFVQRNRIGLFIYFVRR
jgi:hypothetical protein